MRSPSDAALSWLTELADVAPSLPREGRSRRYFSQRAHGPTAPPAPLSLPEVAGKIQKLVESLDRDGYFHRTLGFDCVDRDDSDLSSIADQLGERVDKPDLWATPTPDWTEDDLCDVIEVIFDLVARPTELWYHDYSGCGWHATESSIPSGRRVFVALTNEILATSTLELRLADTGEDTGCVVRTSPDEMQTLVTEVLAVRAGAGDDELDEVAHAVAMFRQRGATAHDQRLAILGLGRILESRRPDIKARLHKKDEGALFRLANEFNLRHNDVSQLRDYGDEFLTWIFYWFLAVVHLTDDLLARSAPTEA